MDIDFKGFLDSDYNNSVLAKFEFRTYISEELNIQIPRENMYPTKNSANITENMKKTPSESTSEYDQLVSNKLSNPLLKIPLTQYGWKREIVSRTTNNSLKNRMYDVYYYSPEGKKLRSSTQILDYLPMDSDLHSGHFSFSKGLIGLDSDVEWVRDAKIRVSSPMITKPIKDKDTNKHTQSKSKESKVTKKLSPQNPNKRRKSKASLYEEEDSLDSVWAPSIPGTTHEAMQNPLTCSILCPAALGCIPTLQCTSCLCLYHPQCLNLDTDTQYYKYVCPNCKKKIQEEEDELKKIKEAKASLKVPITSSDSKVIIAPKPSETLITFTSKVIPSTIQRKTVEKVVRPPIRPLAPVPTHNNAINVVTNQGTKREAPMQTLIQYGKKRFIVVPRQVASTFGRTTSLAGIGGKKVCENQMPVTTKALPVPNMPGLVLSVPKTQFFVLQNGKMETMTPKTVNEQLESLGPTASTKKPITSKLKENVLSVGSNGFHILIQIFRYLPLCDLLRAAQVNQLFYAASRHYSLWKTIQLKNIHVTDWDKFARCLNKNDTETISFNKMIAKTDPEDVKVMWRSIQEALGKISSLRELDLSRCAGPEISIIKQCLHLKRFSCTFDKKCLLDFYGFSSIQNLTHLYIRGFELNKTIGLKVLHIHVLSKLKHLTHLALTSVKQSSHDTNWAMFLADMTQLEWLELGACTNFTNEFVRDALSQLCLLNHLRLEMVTELIANNVLNTISAFPHLSRLELINFDINDGFEESFSKCTNLRSVLIIPTYIKQSAVTMQRMVIALSSMNHVLKRVVWGLTRELLKVTEMLVAQQESLLDPSFDCTDCVPIMPRIHFDTSHGEARKPTQVEVISVDRLKSLLTKELPSVEVKLIRIPYASTSKQFLPIE